MDIQDTICALSTPSGSGAIALIRLSGKEAFPIAQKVAHDLTDIDRYAQLLEIRDEAGLIDEAVVTVFRAPRSYTGEDVVEISVHGSTYIQQRLLESLMQEGARSAKPGEFSLRAFLNRKMDLSQAEAVADLIASTSKAAHNLALQQFKGSYSERLTQMRQELIDLAALIELELDFGEEDVEFADRKRLVKLVQELHTVCSEMIESFRSGNAIKNGVPVAVVGPPNAGKSTLLNRLLKEDRAIVTDIPGTTRDTVQETMVIDGIMFRFIDTAGLRETDDVVEKLGIERSYEAASKAHIILLLNDATAPVEERMTEAQLRTFVGQAPIILSILNKADLLQKTTPSDEFQISATSGDGTEELSRKILAAAAIQKHDQSDLVVTNARHVDALRKARVALEKTREGIDNHISGEFLAEDLRSAQHHLGSITGQVDPDEILGSIFSRFCIGK